MADSHGWPVGTRIRMDTRTAERWAVVKAEIDGAMWLRWDDDRGGEFIVQEPGGWTTDPVQPPEPPQHVMTLGYTISDDGVWIDCSCGWHHNLGFDADPFDAASIASQHLGHLA